MDGEAVTDVGEDTAALLAAASVAGYEVTARLLETLRAQDLLPRPRRVGHRGRTPVWVSPMGTGRQLVALLRWRAYTRDPRVLRVQLWLDGFAMSPDLVREALVANLEAVLEQLERAVADGAHDRDDAIERLAGAVASKRGPHALPRRSRVSARERSRSVELLLRMIGFAESPDVTAGDAAAIERVLGVGPRGRRDQVDGAGPWLTGPPEALIEALDVIALPKALRAVRGASDDELELARGIVVALIRHLPLMARMLAVVTGDDNHAGLGNAESLDDDPHTAMLMGPVVVSMLRAGWSDNLAAVSEALAPAPQLAANTRSLLEMPARQLNANLGGQSPETQRAVDRMVDAALDGRFEPVSRERGDSVRRWKPRS